MIVRTRTAQTKPLGDPAYLDETSLAVPSLGLQRVRLEVSRLGNEVVGIVREGTRVVVSGTIEEINALLERDKEADRLAAEVLHYIGLLSKSEHSEEEGLQMVGFTQIVTSLENISDIIGTNLMAVSQQRLTEQIELTRLNDVAGSRFAQVVIQNLEAVIGAIGETDMSDVSHDIGSKAEIKALAAQARQGILGDLQWAQKSEVLDYQLAVDMVELYRQIARLARGMAKVVGDMRGR
jgi:phosphate:Na+ symporter